MIEFHVAYVVQPKQADRSRIACGKNGKQWVHHYQPGKVTRNARDLALLMAKHRPAEPLRGPVALTLTFVYPHLKSASKKTREQRKPKDTKPDGENLAKQVCDVLERSGFLLNDAQVYDLRVLRFWDDQVPAGLYVKIER